MSAVLFEKLDKSDPDMLVVDLDGTLLRSDMLSESFWSAFGQDWLSPFFSLAALTGGRASLKRHLGNASAVDASTLPYNQEVIVYAKAWRKSGKRTSGIFRCGFSRG